MINVRFPLNIYVQLTDRPGGRGEMPRDLA